MLSKKKFSPISGETKIECHILSEELGWKPEKIWCPAPSKNHSIKPHNLPYSITMGTRDNLDVGAKLSPIIPAIMLSGKKETCAIVIKAQKAWHRWNFAEFKADSNGIKITIDLEGFSSKKEACKKINVFFLIETKKKFSYEPITKLLRKLYPSAFKPAKKIPVWWKKPIYCGWGDQVGMSLKLEGLGEEGRALAYCTQGLYERWINILEKAGVPFETITIDAGWSLAGVWEADPVKWPDLRGFIDKQHRKKRHVLLWIPTWLYEGLPEKWCIKGNNRVLCANPENKEYLLHVKKYINKTLSPDKGCYNADGYKIDQNQYVPTIHYPKGGLQFGRTFRMEADNVKISGKPKTWGYELMYALQKHIYSTAKKVKPDALISSSTLHPYFSDTFDMVRLHDTETVDGVNVFDVMKYRAELSKAVFPDKVIDADDWVCKSYNKWLDYTSRNNQIGVPCIFYAENFVKSFEKKPATSSIKVKDLKTIAKSWSRQL